MLLALLCGGAIINIAVAWGCAVWVSGEILEAMPRPLVLNLSWSHHPPVRLLGFARIKTGVAKWQLEWVFNEGRVRPGSLPYWVTSEVAAAMRDPSRGNDIDLDARGWPLVTAYSMADMDRGVVITGVPIHPESDSAYEGFDNEYALPTAPIWPGFAINTVFYAALMWLLFAAPGFVRRRYRGGRIKRDLCPSCAYPVGESNVCTECGAPKPVRKQA